MSNKKLTTSIKSKFKIILTVTVIIFAIVVGLVVVANKQSANTQIQTSKNWTYHSFGSTDKRISALTQGELFAELRNADRETSKSQTLEFKAAKQRIMDNRNPKSIEEIIEIYQELDEATNRQFNKILFLSFELIKRDWKLIE